MKKIIYNARGFAHPVLLVFLLVGIIGVVAYTGHKVITSNSGSNLPVSQDTTQSNLQSSGEKVAVEVKADEGLTAAADSKAKVSSGGSGQSKSLPKTAKIETRFNVKTPEGSLNQALYELKNQNVSNLLYFITPKVMNNAMSTLGTNDLGKVIKLCQKDTMCRNLIGTDFGVFDNLYGTSCVNPPSGTNCKGYTIYLGFQDGKLTTLHHKSLSNRLYTVEIDLIETSSNWVINRLKVDKYTYL